MGLQEKNTPILWARQLPNWPLLLPCIRLCRHQIQQWSLLLPALWQQSTYGREVPPRYTCQRMVRPLQEYPPFRFCYRYPIYGYVSLFPQSPWIWITPFFLITAPLPPYLFRIWCHWFLLVLLVLSLEIHPHLKIPSSHHFFMSTPRLHMNMMASITRVFLQSVMAPIVSPLSCMSTSAQRTGVLICLILPIIGLISASKDYPWSCISHICLFLVILNSNNIWPGPLLCQHC